MTVDEPLRISLELEPGSDPIRGRLRDQRGSESPFEGWLGLMGAVEAALAVSDPIERKP